LVKGVPKPCWIRDQGGGLVGENQKTGKKRGKNEEGVFPEGKGGLAVEMPEKKKGAVRVTESERDGLRITERQGKKKKKKERGRYSGESLGDWVGSFEGMKRKNWKN